MAEHGITVDVERIGIQRINEAYERLLRGDVKYRFVIDVASPGAVITTRTRTRP